MNLRYLRTFIAIADAGGIARAGPRLNLSQPAASLQIIALEADLGVKLFDRVGRRFRLTSEGEYLLKQSRRLLRDVDSLAEEAQALTKGQAGLLRVGASPQQIESTLAVFLTRFRRRHPGIEVNLVEDGASIWRIAFHMATFTWHSRPPINAFHSNPFSRCMCWLWCRKTIG
jgi:DNA-binding transcriptional LysR family regulator